MRVTVPRVAFAVAATATLVYAFVYAPRLGHVDTRPTKSQFVKPVAQSPAPAGPKIEFPAPGHDFIGVSTAAGPGDFTEVDKFIAAVGHKPTVMMFNEGWAVNQTFDPSAFNDIADRGMMPMLSWEPWDYRVESPNHSGADPDQPKYRLSNIIDGAFDGYIREFADGIKALGYPVALRFAHEMNGFWYPWSTNVNGNKPGDYVKAWRHVHDIFAAAGATNVVWVWSPNVAYAGSTKLSTLYPGDAYVDWIGLSGYYGTGGLTSYVTFNQIFNKTFRDLAKFTHKPVVITETAATNQSGQRTRWIQQLFAEIPAHPNVIGFIWYEAVKELDWRVLTPPSAAKAFGAGAASPLFVRTWSPDMVPRLAVGAG
jgi:hypothetical protein